MSEKQNWQKLTDRFYLSAPSETLLGQTLELATTEYYLIIQYALANWVYLLRIVQ